jgi:hypothetical protein
MLKTKRTGQPGELSAIRSKIDALQSQIVRLEQRPLTLAETKSRLLSALKSVIERDRTQNEFREFAIRSVGRPRLGPELAGDISLSMLAYVFGADAIAQRIAENLTTSLTETRGDPIGAAECNAELARLQSELHQLEVAEESAILAAEDANGIILLRRNDATLAAIFEAWEQHDRIIKGRSP